jgi:hypothetical protein
MSTIYINKTNHTNKGSSETSVLTRATRRNNPEDTILHSHRRENLKSSTAFSPQANLTDWATTAVGEVVPTFAGRGLLRGQQDECLWPSNSAFYTGAATFFFNQPLDYSHEAQWTTLKVTLRHVTSRHATPRHATPRHATPRHATPRHATPRHVTSRHVTSRHATPRHVTSRHEWVTRVIRILAEASSSCRSCSPVQGGISIHWYEIWADFWMHSCFSGLMQW